MYKIEIVPQPGRFVVLLNDKEVGHAKTYFEADNIAAGVEREQHKGEAK